MCTLEAELSLLLRIGHSYGKLGAQVLFSMGALEHLASCRIVGMQIKVIIVFAFAASKLAKFNAKICIRVVSDWLMLRLARMSL